MAAVPKKVAERLVAGLKRYQPILAAARARDVGEADTVTIIKDMLADVFGYDKYSDVTSEHSIRSTFCDLAIKIDGQLQTLIEVKAIGLDLKDTHVKQAIDYAANQGVDWVLLTNGITWRVYHLIFAKPIDQELVLEIDFCALNPRAAGDVELLYLWCKEGWQRSMLGEYHTQRQALSRFFLGALLQTDTVLDVIRRELRRVSPDVRIDTAQIKDVLISEVIKRDVLEGDKADEARKKIARAANIALRTTMPKPRKAKEDAAVEVDAQMEGG
ncbi:type I restriction enzyme HsdR N-terminal domain-containing protein [Lysobacter auxotrophicus]|uniref:Type I restriction enzyme HsdR N-terminal domain-containing protein n=1 Tax=Lysobacter auxotrophicus TaxID=2992573 RepID=A0ABM8DI31_9GAMM|nr:type I restriction enzyme HsdR N-terminal domain-containing protein [Lysobacter auxotrophicus]BDU18277.1 type I restriction enzyme HsdR N-terminal domain-containing protein [Lysobacter auxotrophicus]